jgi:uncharacterized protein (TIGR03067 family)
VYDAVRKSIVDGDLETFTRLTESSVPGASFSKEEFAAFREPFLDPEKPLFPDPKSTEVLKFMARGDSAAVVFRMKVRDREWISLKMIGFHRVNGKWLVFLDTIGPQFQRSGNSSQDAEKIRREVEELVSKITSQPADAGRTGPDQLLGKWTLDYAVVRGTRHGAASGVVVGLEVQGDQWIETGSDKDAPGFRATFKADVSTTPKAIDLVIHSKHGDVTWRGIYKVEGDVLTVCRARTASRPAQFESDEQGETFVEVYKRAGN